MLWIRRGGGPTGCRERTPIRYRTGVSIVQTVLVFVGIPAGIIAVIFVAVYGRSMVRQPNRYRPGKAWDFEPSWYVPHPEAVVASTGPMADKPVDDDSGRRCQR